MRSRTSRRKELFMIPVVVEKCAGLDVHRDMVMACLMWGPAQEEARWEIRRYGTTVGELQELKGWLEEQGCHEVAMESTGVYWEPVFNLLGEEWEEVRRLERQEQQAGLEEEEQKLKQELA